MVPFDRFEQMRSETLHLIDADAPQRPLAEKIEIVVDEFGTERPDRETRCIHDFVNNTPRPREDDGRMQLMVAARKRAQVACCFGPIDGFGEDPVAELQRLVRPEHEIVRIATGYGKRLFAGEM